MAILAGPYIQSTSRRDALICWVTNSTAPYTNSNSEVRIGTNSNNLNMVFKNSSSVVSNSVLSNNYLHVVRVTGLLPDTKYFYTVGNIGTQQTVNTDQYFWTAPVIGENTQSKRFWSQADAGLSNTIETAFNNYNGTTKVNGMLAIGDNAYSSGSFSEYTSLFFGSSAYQTQLRKYNLIACAGNHEYPSSQQTNLYTSRPYFNLIKPPILTETGGIASFNAKYYSWDYGNIHFISLDGYNIVGGVQSVSPNSSQYKWLVNHLKYIKKEKDAGRKKWIIVIEHFPAFSDAGHDTYNSTSPSTSEPGIEFRNVYIPLLHQYDVDLCLYGHDHNYYRTNVIHDFNGANGFSATANVWSPNQGKLGRDSDPYIKTASFSGTVHVVQGNANTGYYTTGGLYGTIPNNLMIASTKTLSDGQTNSATTPPNGPTNLLNNAPGNFLGSSIIDIIPGGGVGGLDRLTYTHLDQNGVIRDYFHIDK